MVYKMKRLLVFVCLLAASSGAVKSQSANSRITDSQFNAWYMYFGTFGLSEKFSLHGEIQFRRSGFIEDPQQLLTRVGLNYHVTKSLALTAGYGFIETYPYGKQPVPEKFSEHRIWQQLFLTHSEGRFFFNHRYRQEQRWLENTAPNADDMIYLNRTRYRFMVSVPLNSTVLDKGAWFLAFYEEIFIGYGENMGSNQFDQNRLYGALGYKTGVNSDVQFGYLNHKVKKGNGVFYENNHTLQVAFTQRL